MESWPNGRRREPSGDTSRDGARPAAERSRQSSPTRATARGAATRRSSRPLAAALAAVLPSAIRSRTSRTRNDPLAADIPATLTGPGAAVANSPRSSSPPELSSDRRDRVRDQRRGQVARASYQTADIHLRRDCPGARHLVNRRPAAAASTGRSASGPRGQGDREGRGTDRPGRTTEGSRSMMVSSPVAVTAEGKWNVTWWIVCS